MTYRLPNEREMRGLRLAVCVALAEHVHARVAKTAHEAEASRADAACLRDAATWLERAAKANEKQAKAQRDRYELRDALGTCVRCGGHRDAPPRKTCGVCAARNAKAARGVRKTTDRAGAIATERTG